MSKDQAARIAEKALGDYEHDTSHLARSIRRAITTAVRKERERCVGIVVDAKDTIVSMKRNKSKEVVVCVCDGIVYDINAPATKRTGNKRKGKR